MDRNGKVVYYLGIQHDVTDELLGSEEVKRLAEQISSVPATATQ
jgi:hypothetical protein